MSSFVQRFYSVWNTVMILGFRIDRSGQTVQTQIRRHSRIRVYTICQSICIFRRHYWKSLNFCVFFIWATSWQNQQNGMSAQRRLRSAWAPTRPVWSESLLSSWRKLGPLATHWAHSEDADKIRLGGCHFVGFVMRRLISRFCLWKFIRGNLNFQCIMLFYVN